MYCLILLFVWIGVLPAAVPETPKIEQQKHVIGNRANCGLWSEFFEVLNHLAWCDEHNRKPVVLWTELLPYYDKKEGGNAWEYYFEPLSDAHYEKNDSIVFSYHNPDGQRLPYPKIFSQKQRIFCNALIKQHIKVKPEIQKEVDRFWQEKCATKNVIAVHIRGTDKFCEAPNFPRASALLQKALEVAKEEKIEPGSLAFLIATDFQDALDEAYATLGKERVIAYPAHRSLDAKRQLHTYVHKPHNEPFSRAQHGKEILTETLIMAKCARLVGSTSNVALAVSLLNPDIKIFCVFPSDAITESGENKYIWPEDKPVLERLSMEERKADAIEDLDYRNAVLKRMAENKL